MGATLTISLIHKKKLWGLVACHHYSPKYLSHQVRLAAKLQGHFITSQIDVRQLNEEYGESRKVNECAKELISKKFDLTRASLSQLVNEPDLLGLCNAGGVSILVEDTVYKTGITPEESDIRVLAGYLSSHTAHTYFHTDSAIKVLPDFKDTAEKTPGLHYVSLDHTSDNCIIWYRPETLSEVHWAGDPHKSIERDANGLSPRKSFDLWKETVKLQSKPWMPSELTTSLNFANVLQKHLSSVFLAEEEEKQRELAQKLTETNAELENINWISTHDLQEPLRKIRLMSSFIAEEEKDLPESVYEKVIKINKSAQRLQALLRDILKYTSLNYSKDAFEAIDLNELIADITKELEDALKQKSATLTVSALPVIYGIPFLLRQLFQNLIYNSLKFSSNNRLPSLHISASEVFRKSSSTEDTEEPVNLITYTDNGIGFDPAFNESVFNIFARLHSPDAYEGSGVGLALCKKIMSRHEGSIKASGRKGEGADFFLYFPKR